MLLTPEFPKNGVFKIWIWIFFLFSSFHLSHTLTRVKSGVLDDDRCFRPRLPRASENPRHWRRGARCKHADLSRRDQLRRLVSGHHTLRFAWFSFFFPIRARTALTQKVPSHLSPGSTPQQASFQHPAPSLTMSPRACSKHSCLRHTRHARTARCPLRCSQRARPS